MVKVILILPINSLHGNTSVVDESLVIATKLMCIPAISPTVQQTHTLSTQSFTMVPLVSCMTYLDIGSIVRKGSDHRSYQMPHDPNYKYSGLITKNVIVTFTY